LKSASSTLQRRENRVRRGVYDRSRLKSSLLTRKGRFSKGKNMHKLVAKRIEMLVDAWMEETGLPAFTVKSAIRKGPERWNFLKGGIEQLKSRSETKEILTKSNSPGKGKQPEEAFKNILAMDPAAPLYDFYEAFLLDRYAKPGKSRAANLKYGKALYAYDSPHATGLVIDFKFDKDPTRVVYEGTPTGKKYTKGPKKGQDILIPKGAYIITTTSSTKKYQKQTHWHKWMINNAWRFGVSPYKVEPWHWEVQMPLDSYYEGKDWVTDGNYAVRVTERHNKTKKITEDKMFRTIREGPDRGELPRWPDGAIK